MKLLIADDHTLFRDVLVQYIVRAEPSAEILLAKDFSEAYSLLKADKRLDLVLLDFKMPGMDGLGGVEKMRAAYPDVPLALMSGVAESKDVQGALDLGVVAYFPKTMSGKALLKAIQSVLAGESFVPFDVSSHRLMPSYHADERDPAGLSSEVIPEEQSTRVPMDFHLTPREKDVLGYLARGDSNKVIATALGLQVVTIKLHVRGICRKLNAQNRTQAALIAREAHLVHEGGL